MAVRFAAILADRRWADPMPIWTFLIQHPQGNVVVDAGATPDYNDEASWAHDPRAGKLLRSFLRIDVDAEETLPAQLDALGVGVDAVSSLVLTHQHIDHTASVPSFGDVELWTTAAEDRAAAQTGANPWRWRTPELTVRHVDVEGVDSADAELGREIDLFGDGSLRIIHTPGHTPGSVSVVLDTDQAELWFTGDTSFTAASMNPAADTAGIHTDMAAVRRLHQYLHQRGVILPSHDPDNAARLAAAGVSPS